MGLSIDQQMMIRHEFEVTIHERNEDTTPTKSLELHAVPYDHEYRDPEVQFAFEIYYETRKRLIMEDKRRNRMAVL